MKYINIADEKKEKDISQIWNFCRNTANNINFNYRTNLEEINNQINDDQRNPIFSSFLQFSRQSFFQKIRSRVSSTMPKFGKN